ncbi:double-strand break repair protein MRE11 [Coccinella septempunctata]|uniref:double-strand break repair protein MRE11 n=1 Tax=Coccinella septempunctata TaxID=41139 RepID=UPI001D074BE6|nr:double-strand break repair protein MRE11 [Coccinella septempunctata]
MDSEEDTINDSFEDDEMTQNEPIETDQFKIMLATDIHLGYKENDSIRGEDTFNTFEEILKIAIAAKVDFILLGGDLFHDTKPSPSCFNKCIRLLRKYCLGDNPVSIEILSDQQINFDHTLNKQVNYEDPNLNVGIPVFSIHGNHDDPTGRNHVSAMDLLASSGLVNYFGRWQDLTRVEINPILMRKGRSLLALYGLSHISDQRLGRLFLEKKVSIAKPDNFNNQEFFNLLVLHQNRAPRGPKNFIPADAIPKDIDLVMWGHEHDCRITPEKVGEVFITQPGSSVATSLAAGEALTKKVGILRIHKKQFKIDEIELRTVRPFIFEDLLLDFPEVPMQDQLEKCKKVISMHVEQMIEKAAQLNRIPEGILPLIRLRAHYKHEDQLFNAIKFSQQFVGRVANPEDILKFISVSGAKRQTTLFDKDLDEDIRFNPNIRRVEDIILKYFVKNEMTVLSAKGLTDGVMKYIDTDDNEAPLQIIDHQFEKTLKKMKELDPEEDEIESCLENLRQMRGDQDEDEEVKNILSRRAVNKSLDSDDDAVSIIIDDDDDADASRAVAATSRPARGRGSRGGRGSRNTRGGTRGRGKAKEKA